MAHDVGEVTRYGFKWGPLDVFRAALLPKEVRVLGITTGKDTIHVRSTKTGKLRVFTQDGRELKAT